VIAHLEFGEHQHSYELECVPDVGASIYLSFAIELRAVAGYWTDEALEKFKRLDGTWWTVAEVRHELTTSRHHVRVRCTEARGRGKAGR